MNSRRICFFVLFFLCGIILFAGDDDQEKPETTMVTGIIRLIGTGNFPQIVITTEDKEWYLPKEDADKLFNMQRRKVTVEGEGSKRELKFASGRSAGIRYELRNIKIISVDNSAE
jgi:hypothetical protein